MDEVSKDAEKRYKDKLIRTEKMETFKKQAILAFKRAEYVKALTLFDKVRYEIFKNVIRIFLACPGQATNNDFFHNVMNVAEIQNMIYTSIELQMLTVIITAYIKSVTKRPLKRCEKNIFKHIGFYKKHNKDLLL